MPLMPRSSPEPDAIDVELFLLGAVQDPEQRAQIRAAMEGPLAEEVNEIEAYQALFRAEARPLTPSRPRWYGWGLPALLAAAVALLFVLAGRPTGLRSMGTTGLSVDVQVSRAERPIPSDAPLRAGDLLSIALTAPSDGWLHVGVIQEDGQAFALVAGEDHPVEAGEPTRLAGAVRLDNWTGRDWLVVAVLSEPLEPLRWEGAMASLLPDPVADAPPDWYVMDVTRGR